MSPDSRCVELRSNTLLQVNHIGRTCFLLCLIHSVGLYFPLSHLLHAAESFLRKQQTRPVKKFPAFYGTRRFITAFTTARHCPYPKIFRPIPLPLSYPASITLLLLIDRLLLLLFSLPFIHCFLSFPHSSFTYLLLFPLAFCVPPFTLLSLHR
jgi:hypothetical protein